jgi:hypothetical protein
LPALLLADLLRLSLHMDDFPPLARENYRQSLRPLQQWTCHYVDYLKNKEDIE